jgi:hypothetical protein
LGCVVDDRSNHWRDAATVGGHLRQMPEVVTGYAPRPTACTALCAATSGNPLVRSAETKKEGVRCRLG